MSNFFFKQHKRKKYLFFQQLSQRRNEQFLLQATEKEELFILSATVTQRRNEQFLLQVTEMIINMCFELKWCFKSKCALNQNDHTTTIPKA